MVKIIKEGTGTFVVSFKNNGVYQTNLVDADSADSAKAAFSKKNPSATITGVRPATSGDKKPGIPHSKAATEGNSIKLTSDEQHELIKQADAANTYICGADGKLCGHPREMKIFPCDTCKRNKHWKYPSKATTEGTPPDYTKKNWYKIEQLEKMIRAEEGPDGGYGAYLKHSGSNTKTLTIGLEGLKVLLDYYRTHDDDEF